MTFRRTSTTTNASNSPSPSKESKIAKKKTMNSSSDIVIRPYYRSMDKDGVFELYQEGILPMADAAATEFCFRTWTGRTLLSLFFLVTAAASTAFYLPSFAWNSNTTTTTTTTPPTLSLDNFLSAVVSWNPLLRNCLIKGLITSMTLTSAAVLLLRKWMRRGLLYFLQRAAIQDDEHSMLHDLHHIEKTYMKRGHGCFLVAVDAATHPNKLVGMVGAHDHTVPQDHSQRTTSAKSSREKEENNTPVVVTIELKRMIVAKDYQRLGIAQQLIAGLQQHVLSSVAAEQQHQEQKRRRQQGQAQQGESNNRQIASTTTTVKIFLTCSMHQKPAHRLYQSMGFRITKAVDYRKPQQQLPTGRPKLGFVTRQIMATVYTFEKELQQVSADNNNKNKELYQQQRR